MTQFDYEHDPADGDRRTRSAAPSLPTILASAGIACIVSALIVTIGVMGLLIADRRAEGNSASSTPTVVNLGSAQTGMLPSGTSPNNGTGAEAAAAPPQGSAPAAQVPAEQVPEGGAGAGAGNAPQAAAPPGGVVPAPQQATGSAGSQPTTSAPSALTPGQLNTKIKLIMNTGASRAARADELQSGARGLGPIDQVAQMLRVSGAGFTYQMVGPVRATATNLSATLQMSLVGNGSRYRTLTWVWAGAKWKLSDRSVCDVAAYALIP